MCQADYDKIIFWLRNLPVMVRPPWLDWSLGDFEKNGEDEERWMGSACLMGDAPFSCLLMSHSLMGHHDQRQESSKKLFKPVKDSWPFIVIKVEKVQRILQQPRLDRVGKRLFFLDWRPRDLLFRYHSNGTGYFLFFVEKSDIKGQHLDTFLIWNRWNWTHFVFRWKIGSLKNWTQYFNNRTHFWYETDGSVSIRYGYQYEIQFFWYEVRYQSYWTSYRCFSFAV
jgi:hypothetical protein